MTGRLGRSLAAPPHFFVISFTTMMLVTGVNILAPVLPGYARSFQVSATEVGMVISAFAVGRLMFDFVGGSLSDRFGVRSICIVGCAVTAVASLVCGVTDSFVVLLAARLVQGTGSALYMGAATTLVVSLLPSGREGRWMSAFQGIFLMGLAIGPVIGGAVAELGPRAPFHAYAAMCLIALVLSVVKLPRRTPDPAPGGSARGADPRSGSKQRRDRRTAVTRLLHHPAFLVSLVIVLVMFSLRSGLRNTGVPLYGGEVLGLPAGMLGLLLTTAAVGQLAVMWHAGASLDVWGRRPVVVASLLLTTLTVLAFPLAVEAWILFVLMLLLGVVTAYSTAAPTVILVDVADTEVPGTAIGIQRSATDVGQLLGPVMIGGLLDLGSHTIAFLVTAGMVAVAAGLSIAFLPETRPTQTEEGVAEPLDAAR